MPRTSETPLRSYSQYLFEYRYDDATWGIQIAAKSPAEARARVRALTCATYRGKIATKVPIPRLGLKRLIASLFRLNKAI